MKDRTSFKTTVLCVLAVCLALCVAAGARAQSKKVRWVKSPTGVSSLMTLSKDMGQMNRQLKEETRNYEEVRSAICGRELKEGENASDIQRKYGSPVMVLSEKDGQISRWVYKSASDSYFEGEKAYLLFGDDGKLLRWELVEQKDKKRTVLFSGPGESSS